MQRQKLITGVVGVTALVVGLVMSLSAEVPHAARTVPSRRVRVAAVETVAGGQAMRFAGSVRAAERAALGFTLGGRLASRSVEVGDRVAAGQVLARLDARELANAVDAVAAGRDEIAARLAQLERDAVREEQLAERKASTREDVERARSGVDALRAARDAAEVRLREQRRLLAEADLRAPFAGVVSEVLLEPGENAAPGRPVVVISGAGGFEVEVGVPEPVLATVAVGQRVSVELPLAGGAQVSGTVRSVGRSTVGSGQLFPVVVGLAEAPGLSPGVTVNVEVAAGAGRALAVPLAAILNPGGARPAVFRLVGDRAERVAVQVDGLQGELVLVRGELAAGEEVVVAGHGSLVSGDGVEVVR